MLGKLLRLGQIIKNPSTIPALFSWRPFSIESFTMMSTLRRRGYVFRTIIDGGANIGQFARTSTELYPEAAIYSFEPNPSTAKIFRTNLANRPAVHLYETALGNHDGMITFYPSSFSQESSIFVVNNNRQATSVSVTISKLDTVMAGLTLEPPILLKLDLQGYELEALKGAKSILPKCEYVLTEVEFKASNQDEPTFADLQEYLAKYGFRFIHPVAFSRDEFGEISQMDALFQKYWNLQGTTS